MTFLKTLHCLSFCCNFAFVEFGHVMDINIRNLCLTKLVYSKKIQKYIKPMKRNALLTNEVNAYMKIIVQTYLKKGVIQSTSVFSHVLFSYKYHSFPRAVLFFALLIYLYEFVATL